MADLVPRPGPVPGGATTYMVTERELALAVRRHPLLTAREEVGDLRGPGALVVAGTLLSITASTWSLYL